MDILQVDTIAQLRALKNHEEGELAIVGTMDGARTMYRWTEADGWTAIEIEMNSDEASMNSIALYDLNKSIIGQLPPLENIRENEIIIDTLTNYNNKHMNSYYMLLCKECSYYTVFKREPFCEAEESFAKVVLDIIDSLGTVYSVEETEQGAIESWITIKGADTPAAFYLFPYDEGVVTFG